MSYVAPSTRSTGNLITAAIWNQDIRDNREFMFNRPVCQVYRTSNQSIANVTLTAINFDAEIVDNASMHDTVTNNENITIQTAGVYFIHGMVKFASAAASIRLVRVLVGASTVADNIMRNATTTEVEMSISVVWKAAASEAVRLAVYHEAGVSINIISDGTFRPRAGVCWIGSGV